MADRSTLSYLSEARQALNDYARLKKEIAFVETDRRLTLIVRRALWGGAAATSGVVALVSGWAWFAWGLHERGWKSHELAVLSLAAFGIPSIACALIATRRERKPTP